MTDTPDVTAEPQSAMPRRSRRRPRTLHESRVRRRRLVTWALLVGSAILMVNALVGENGYLATVRARRDYEALLASAAKLRLENARLTDEIVGLKADPATLEDAARRQLGLARPGETLVIIRDASAPGSVPR
jgi:cell division protein FtsB